MTEPTTFICALCQTPVVVLGWWPAGDDTCSSCKVVRSMAPRYRRQLWDVMHKGEPYPDHLDDLPTKPMWPREADDEQADEPRRDH